MKLVWAIVQNEDAGNAMKALNAKGYRATRINTVGGLLKRGNVTILAGVEPEQVDDVINTLREHCQARGASKDAPAERARAVVFVLDAPGFLQV
ncbi:MAG: cyclic-di-AMP receptor [Chloroflexi bacterium]|nr:cyclic-di-AMP receptor [Chloroflexota bacterium]